MNTKANLATPPSKRRSALAQLDVKPIEAADNMSSGEFKDLSFRVDADWHHRFKTSASMHRVSMKKILEEGFELWLAEQERKRK